MSRRLPAFLETPYDDCTLFQSQSTELVVFSPSAGEYVTIAWPTYHGRRIVPHRIKGWLRNRGLHWPCFCSLTFGGSTSTRIVDALSGSVYAFCNGSSVCGFRINLTQIYQTATHESEYGHLPLLATGVPDMASLRTNFRSIGSTQQGPYFRGYCGEHESEYQGIIQLAGTPPAPTMQTEYEGAHARNRARLDEESRRARALIIPPRRTSLAYTRIRGHSNSTINWSAAQLDNTGPLAREQDIIDRLQAGEGTSGVEMSSLFEKCTLCDRYFIASLLRVHIRGCAPAL